MKRLILLSLSLVFVVSAYTQEVDILGGLYKKEHVPDRGPIPYHTFRQSDAMWTKIVWRKLDLREKINLPLYYPIESKYDLNTVLQPQDDRFNLVSLLLFMGIGTYGYATYLETLLPNVYPDQKIVILEHLKQLEELNAKENWGELGRNRPGSMAMHDRWLNYFVYDDHEFKVPQNFTKIWGYMGGGLDSVIIYDENGMEVYDANGMIAKRAEFKEIRPGEVTELKVKEVWYFDKNRAKMEVRIVAICPTRYFLDPIEKKQKNAEIGWFYFPAFRPILATHEVFNTSNDAERMSFDDLFWKRRFSSFVYAETNVYNNRLINEYQYGLDALLEADKIKDWMFEIEHDLWNY
ncbi:MAG: hypothetical protein A2W91_12585 [Bacteroidetes bacterium GWF2_38_335]|nr:MAG: hypothetical protein A2W91_12585 [Bacteroidetes bacterium GWF2_38_335]OFY77003.1 MAG: hypothetical protein A2281_00700 [Bacteroidetes bacterium RIFOXYA12_FULL_38_20]HBS86861.1 hypothetical protein [Bacteroidales bacterium]